MLSSRPIQLGTDGTYFPTKTPGRGHKNRAENAYAGMGVAMTVQGKGKNAGMPPRTPFQPSSAQPKHLIKEQKFVLTTTGRPLVDKTPLPNRTGTILFKTPLPGNSQLSHLRNEGGNADEEESGTPESAQRPSSMRKHIKHPRISGKALETPVNNGNHWDVSDGDIVLPDAQSLLQETIAEDNDHSDELEYGPPNTLDLPYRPPFDFTLPDYREVGKSLFKLAHSSPYGDIVPPLEPDIPSSQLEEPKWDMISLPDIESDDPFHLARVQASSSSKLENVKPAVSSRYNHLRLGNTTAATAPSVKQRPQSSLSRVGPSVTSRPTSRTATSTVSVKRNASVPATTAKVTSVKSRITTGKPFSRPVVITTLSTKSLSNTKSRPLASTTGVQSTSVKHPPGILVAGKPPATHGLRRPHTSMASTKIKTTMTHRSGLDAQNSTVDPDVALVKDIGNSFDDELGFKFEV